MYRASFVAELEAAFVLEELVLPSGRILRPRRRFNLQRALTRAATGAERADIASDPWSVLDKTFKREPLLEFVWHSGWPISSLSAVRLLEVGGPRVFVTVFQDIWAEMLQEPELVIAAVKPKYGAGVLSAFATSLLDRNGARYGIRDLFANLPTYTTNYRPDLSDASVIKESYWRWMECRSGVSAYVWMIVRESVIQTAIDPNHS